MMVAKAWTFFVVFGRLYNFTVTHIRETNADAKVLSSTSDATGT